MQELLLSLKDTLLKVAFEAGEAILQIYQKDDFEEELKVDNSPLTQADRAANQIICEAAQNIKPRYPIISEENKQVPFEARKDYFRYWLIDPLDGTKEFIKRNGEFTVNIALIENGMPILGVVYAPVLNEMYWAIKGLGSFLKEDDKEISLKVNDFEISQSNLRFVCSRSHLNEKTEVFLQGFTNPETVSRGSSLKFLLLARNQADIYPRLAPTMEWDTAAAQIILEEAGGKVINFETKKPLIYNKEDLLNPFFIAYGNLSESV